MEFDEVDFNHLLVLVQDRLEIHRKRSNPNEGVEDAVRELVILQEKILKMLE
jgi:hypothetical protein